MRHSFLARLALAALLTVAPATSSAQGSRGWLGIAMATDVGGVRIEHVIHGSPAERAGLRADDRILQVEHVPVGSPRDVMGLVGRHAGGETVAITLVRAGKTQQVSIVLGDYPSSDAMLRMDHVGNPAPTWDGLQPTQGFPASVEGLRGQVVVVDFWATWCGPCREVAPILSHWQTRYGAQGLHVVGITTDSAEAASTFKERLGLRYPMASDPDAKTSAAYGISALPTLFIVDKRGVVRDVAVGWDPAEDARMEALLNTLLAEPATSP